MAHSDRPTAGAAEPPQALMNLITGKWIAQAIAVAAKLGIADLLKDGPRDRDELARANQMDARSLHRLLRALASVGVFAEVEAGQFALTPMAEALRSDVPGSLRAVATMAGEDWTWRPWGDLYGSVKTAEPAFDRVFGMGAFTYLEGHPGAASLFDEAMTGWSAQEAAAVVAHFDFSGIGTLVDVGGGHGRLLAAVLEAHPAMRGVLFDLPAVVDRARGPIAASGLAGRCEVVGGDVFASVPEGGDAYILKHVIHDWDDERSVTILRNCRRAMGPGGRLLLVEMVIPPGNGPFLGKLLDLEMLVMATGRERTEAEYRDLLADAGFRLTRVVPTSAPVSVIEGLPA